MAKVQARYIVEDVAIEFYELFQPTLPKARLETRK